MRTLWYVPVLHTSDESFIAKEAAALSEELRLAVERNDRRLVRAWKRLSAQLDAHIGSGRIRPEGLLVFCDSLPHPLSKFPELLRPNRFEGRSPTWNLIWRLKEMGAVVCGTENPAILIVYSEYKVSSGPEASLQKETQTEKDLLALRDLWIANHIDKTLPEGSAAIIFMGAVHRVDQHLRELAPDIRIKYLRTIAPDHRS